MIFTPLAMDGVSLVEVERREDHCGFDARLCRAREFQERAAESSRTRLLAPAGFAQHRDGS